MNAITPIAVPAATAAWDEAGAAIDAWRGQTLHCFARAEVAVSETLLTLRSAERKGAEVRLRRLVGQRFEDLQSAIGPDGAFAMEGRKACAALGAFRRHEDLRIFLCHGVAKVTLDKHGQWLVVMKVLAFRGREAERSTLSYERREAEAVLSALSADSKALGSALQSLRDRIAAIPKARD